MVNLGTPASRFCISWDYGKNQTATFRDDEGEPLDAPRDFYFGWMLMILIARPLFLHESQNLNHFQFYFILFFNIIETAATCCTE